MRQNHRTLTPEALEGLKRARRASLPPTTNRLDLSPAVVSELVAAGLIETDQHPTNGSTRVKITGKGWELLAEAVLPTRESTGKRSPRRRAPHRRNTGGGDE